LVVQLLLLCWPTERREQQGQLAANRKGLPELEHQEFCWGWLLLLLALLQRAPVAVKQQLYNKEGYAVKELLQLLHKALVDQEQLEGSGDQPLPAKLLLWAGCAPGMLTNLISGRQTPAAAAAVGGTCEPLSSDTAAGASSLAVGAPMGIVKLILLTLESLMLTANPWEVLGSGEVKEAGSALEIKEGN
jgi:hypothetical protein